MTGASAAAADHAASAAGDSPAVGAIAIVGGRAALLVPGGNLLAPVAELKAALLGDDPVDAFLRLVSRTALAELPPFVCAMRETDKVRLLVRGSAGALVRSADGFEVKLTATRVATWAERVVDSPAEILLFADVADSSATTLSRGGSGCAWVGGRASDVADSSATTLSLLWADLGALGGSRAAAARPSGSGEELRAPLVEEPGAAVGQPHIDLGHLLERTGYRDVEDAAVRGSDDERPAALADLPPRAKHARREMPTMQEAAGVDEIQADQGANDGNTVSMAQIRAAVASSAAGTETSGAQVQTILCGRGHANPPYADRCRNCGAGIIERRIEMRARPSLGRLRFSDGLVVELDRPALVGRRPKLPPAGNEDGEAPALIAIPDPELLLSRVHAEVRLDGWQVLVVDRHSVNCTYVEVPGQPVRQLRPDEPFLIDAGTRVDLAHIAAFVYEVAEAGDARR